jgi:hypothetical protein
LGSLVPLLIGYTPNWPINRHAQRISVIGPMLRPSDTPLGDNYDCNIYIQSVTLGQCQKVSVREVYGKDAILGKECVVFQLYNIILASTILAPFS